MTSTPAGIQCPSNCTLVVAHGTRIALTAAPIGDSTFVSWSDGCSGTAACAFTVDADVTVNASFALSYSLTLSRAGTGAGTVTSSPPGIDCGGICTASYPYATSVVLTASASGASSFAGWSGGGCSGFGTCTVAMTAARTVVATFTATVSPNYMFVTSTTSTGNLGGLAGADAICQARAQSVGLPGTYRAWLSTTTIAAIDRLGGASGWIRVDGKPFARTITEMANGQIYYPPRLDERGNDVLEQLVFTATNVGGGSSSADCSGWTSDAGTSVDLGHTGGSGWSWTSHVRRPCNGAARLFCFGIDHAASVHPTPVTGVRRAFMVVWTPGGGIPAADAACQGSAQTAGLGGSFKALLPTSSFSALSRFNFAGANWYRTDDVPCLGSAAAWATATYFDANPNVNASKTETAGQNIMWSGANSLTTPGTAASTCSDWTNQAATAHSGSADTNKISDFVGQGSSGVMCTNAGWIPCLQE